MKILEYKGKAISYVCGMYWAFAKPFDSLQKAQKHIDEQLEN